MKIAYFSDVHLEFSPFAPPKVDVDVVVLAGDIYTRGRGAKWARQTFPGSVIVQVAGNHEFYGDHWDWTLKKMRRRAVENDVLFLENDAVVNSGVRFLGCTLWTDFRLFDDRHLGMAVAARRLNDYQRISVGRKGVSRDQHFGERPGKLSPVDVAGRHEESVNWLRRCLAKPFEGPTVVVTHHAPSFQSIPGHSRNDRLSSSYASRLDHLIEKADVWIHGHIHESVSYCIGGARVVSNPRGYTGDGAFGRNWQFDPHAVLYL